MHRRLDRMRRGVATAGPGDEANPQIIVVFEDLDALGMQRTGMRTGVDLGIEVQLEFRQLDQFTPTHHAPRTKAQQVMIQCLEIEGRCLVDVMTRSILVMRHVSS